MKGKHTETGARRPPTPVLTESLFISEVPFLPICHVSRFLGLVGEMAPARTEQSWHLASKQSPWDSQSLPIMHLSASWPLGGPLHRSLDTGRWGALGEERTRLSAHRGSRVKVAQDVEGLVACSIERGDFADSETRRKGQPCP